MKKLIEKLQTLLYDVGETLAQYVDPDHSQQNNYRSLRGLQYCCYYLLSRQYGRALRTLRWWCRSGFGEDEVWSLDYTVAEFLLPRFRLFRKTGGEDMRPCTVDHQEWLKILDQIETALKLLVAEPHRVMSDGDFRKIDRGLELLGRWLRYLWT